MILFNNQFTERDKVNIDMEDRGYQFGDGVYEVVRVYNGVCFRMESHMARLKRSAAEIGMTLPYSLENIEQLLLKLVEKNAIHTGNVYIQISRGVAPRDHQIPANITPILLANTKEVERPIYKIKEGISCILTEDVRWLRCDIKSLNLLGSVMATQKANQLGYGEAILHRRNMVTEASSKNVFMIKDGTIKTHPANHLILDGITRVEVLDIAKEKNLPVVEEAFSTDELLQADEVFVTSTTAEITPVTKIDETIINKGQSGPITQMLQQAFEQRIPKHGDGSSVSLFFSIGQK